MLVLAPAPPPVETLHQINTRSLSRSLHAVFLLLPTLLMILTIEPNLYLAVSACVHWWAMARPEKSLRLNQPNEWIVQTLSALSTNINRFLIQKELVALEIMCSNKNSRLENSSLFDQ